MNSKEQVMQKMKEKEKLKKIWLLNFSWTVGKDAMS
jgi:hypothetical protein